jgi:hypothetical protein
MFISSALTLSAQEKNKKELNSVRLKQALTVRAAVNTHHENFPFEKGVKDVKCDLTTKE